MKMYSTRLKGFLVTRNSWRTRPQNIQNDLQEDVPWALVMRRGLKEAKRGWTSQPFASCWHSGNVFLNQTSRITEADVDSGWGGGLSLKETRERWSRHGSIIPANHLDNFRQINGATVTHYEHIRWGMTWATRAFKGWTASAALSDIFREIIFSRNAERTIFEGWSIGVPRWYAEHQP